METPDLAVQRAIDSEHLKLLALFHYIQGGFVACFAFFPLIYAFMGGFMLIVGSVETESAEQFPDVIGWFFIGFGVMGSLLIIAIAVLKIYAGWCISQRKNRIFCLVIAGLNCFSMPYGTALGICTIMVLLRPAVSEAFSTGSAMTTIDPGSS